MSFGAGPGRTGQSHEMEEAPMTTAEAIRDESAFAEHVARHRR